MSEQYRVVLTTTDSAEEAEELGRGIVEQRLAACMQIVGPIRSIYRWEETIQNGQEWQCWIKTTTDCIERLTDFIKIHHSYDVPEIVVLDITGGSPEYLSWVLAETRPSST
ncbi:divalent-cation tolerance protein CutA [Amycolatopsis sp. H20-H5]|uniref:divalent-cation tolerance protein CutA n=1 Tax=Amycolatopsis sp. H20-H5 TaxID=3046309 RepID=UPI002DC020BC|nr:divalent-cation tolerance protein CutA [Amycolatopsis sp. H20-H5]MEC3978612.1 divalent-cation tolerance protein CutA [Amycolatopsis sp. H20-H5]